MTARAFVVTIVALGALPARAAAQDVVQALNNPVRFTGEMTTMGQLYGHSGIAARWPDASYSVTLTPQLTLFNDVSAGMNILLSSQGDQVRQSLNQFGLNPSYRWITVHLGDFTDDYTENTLQGTRVRGFGVDLKPGAFRFSFQEGQSQRATFAGAGAATYARQLFAGLIGLGHESGSFLNLTIVKAKDDPNSLTPSVTDTILLDTIPVALRPQAQTRPEENLVLGLSGQISLLDNRLVVKGEGDGAVITNDLSSPTANASSVRFGGLVSSFMPIHLSTSGDFAYKLDGTYAFGAASVHAGYQYVGAGYTSLGLAYVINDRQAYTLGGTVALAQGRLVLLGQVQHQNDDLLHQKLATTNQDAVMVGTTVRPVQDVSASVTVMSTVVANDAANDTFALNDRTLSVNSSLALQHRLFGLPAVSSLAYGVQQASNVSVITPIPHVEVQNLSASVQVTLSKAISVAPSLSLSTTQTQGAPTQDNLFVGFRCQGQFVGGKLRASLDATQTFASGRAVVSVTPQGSYALPWASRLSLQIRYSKYGAIGTMPAFAESFATLSLARSL